MPQAIPHTVLGSSLRQRYHWVYIREGERIFLGYERNNRTRPWLLDPKARYRVVDSTLIGSPIFEKVEEASCP